MTLRQNKNGDGQSTKEHYEKPSIRIGGPFGPSLLDDCPFRAGTNCAQIVPRQTAEPLAYMRSHHLRSQKRIPRKGARTAIEARPVAVI